MESLENYLEEKRKEIKTLEKEVALLEAAGLPIKISQNEHRKIEYEMTDYNAADTLAIEHYGSLGGWYDLIQFKKTVKTLHGDLTVFCRHPGWRNDDMRYAQLRLSDYRETRRHDPASLIEFYKEKGVPPALLTQLEQDVATLYKKPTAEKEDEEEFLIEST